MRRYGNNLHIKIEFYRLYEISVFADDCISKIIFYDKILYHCEHVMTPHLKYDALNLMKNILVMMTSAYHDATEYDFSIIP